MLNEIVERLCFVQKREQWEEMKETSDERHVQFPGSRGEAAILDLVHRVTRNLPVRDNASIRESTDIQC